MAHIYYCTVDHESLTGLIELKSGVGKAMFLLESLGENDFLASTIF